MPIIPNDPEFIRIYIVFQTRNVLEFDAFFDCLRASFDKIKNGESLPEESKITLRQYAIMRCVASLKSVIQHLDQYHDQAADLNHKINLCHEIVNFFERGEFERHFKVGLFMGQGNQQDEFDQSALIHFYLSLNRLVTLNPDKPQLDQTIKPSL